MASEMVLELAIAVGTLLVSSAISDEQAKSAEKRQERADNIKAIYQVVTDRYGITQNQLDQVLSKLDLKLSQLENATRGSARLSRASKTLRSYLDTYPQIRDTVYNARNVISDEVADLQKKANDKAAKVTARGKVSDVEILGDLGTSLKNVNETINSVNGLTSSNKNEINTQLTDYSADQHRLDKAKEYSDKSAGYAEMASKQTGPESRENYKKSKTYSNASNQILTEQDPERASNIEKAIDSYEER